MNKKAIKGNEIYRFTAGSRLGHWGYVIAFICLLVTGCALIFHGFGNLIGAEGLRLFGKVHRFFGIFLTFVPIIILLVFSNKATRAWLGGLFRFTREDGRFVAGFPKAFFSGKYPHVKQGRFNGGEKINSILQILGFLIMAITGWIMMFPQSFGADTLLWVRTIHSFFALALGAIMLGHAYLGLLHPDSRASFKGMITGYVPMKFARAHHEAWVEEVEAAEKERSVS